MILTNSPPSLEKPSVCSNARNEFLALGVVVGLTTFAAGTGPLAERGGDVVDVVFAMQTGIRSRANQPCRDGLSSVGSFPVPENKRDVSTHAPRQAPLRAHRGALSTRPRRGVHQAMSSVSKFSGFVLDSSRSYAK